MADKEQIESAAEYCEIEANKALDRGLDFTTLASGPSSALADFVTAGALFGAAALLRERLEGLSEDKG